MAAYTPPRSVVECIGYDSSRCGYCSRPNSSRSFGVWAHQLDVRDYQSMLDAGWRRSGSYLYRPDIARTCCQTFVVRLEAARFVPSSTHKRVLKRVRRYAQDRHLLTANINDMTSSTTSKSSTPIISRKHSSTQHSSDSRPVTATDTVVRCTERDSLLSVIRTAAAQSAQSGDLGPLLIDCIDDIILGRCKVFPPRRSNAGKTNGTAQHDRLQTANNQPLWCSNVALTLAASERSKVSNGSDFRKRNEKAVEENQNPSNKDRGLARQLAIARVLAARIRDQVRDRFTISVTGPGFLNFHQAITLESSSADTDIDIAAPTDVNTVHQQLDPTGARAKRLRPKRLKDGISIAGEITSTSRPRSQFLREEGGNINMLAVNLDVPVQKEGSTTTYFTAMTALMKDEAFTMELVPSQFRPDAYELFKRYQMTVHKESLDQCGREAYLRFLVDSPLMNERVSSSSDFWYGSFHALYKLDGRLFAVGVVDILPRCLSSVYLFYDPEFARLSPGTLSALKEIEWTQRAEPWYPSLRYYYMGFYIHSCPKMRYKAAYYPSELLCDATKNWLPAMSIQHVLDANNGRCTRLAPEDMRAAPEASDFNLSDDEITRLANESKLELTFSNVDGGKERRIVSLGTLTRLLNAQCPEQLETVRSRLKLFVKMIGKSNSKFFMHVL